MRVVWTRLALNDLDRARAYIETENPQAAGAVIDRIEGAIHALGKHPRIGRPGRIAGTRELVVVGTPFIVPYRVGRETIEVLAVIHSARRWPDEL